MKSFISWIYGVALLLGGPGLFTIAFLDSSFISLPQINDILVVLMVTENKPLMLYYAAMATLGSIAGCYVIYYLARKGGDAFLQKRLRPGHTERALAMYQRHGLLALMVPALLPPPAPFKIFVLLAGVAHISTARFAIAIGVGRGLRYFGEGLLAVWYGDAAIEYLENNLRFVSLVVVGLVLAALAGYVIFSKARAGKSR